MTLKYLLFIWVNSKNAEKSCLEITIFLKNVTWPKISYKSWSVWQLTTQTYSIINMVQWAFLETLKQLYWPEDVLLNYVFGQSVHFLRKSFSWSSEGRSSWISELNWNFEEIKIVLGSYYPLPSANTSERLPHWSVHDLEGDHDESSSKIFMRKVQFW